MGLHDIIQPTLLAGQDILPFILVRIRLKQKDTDFTIGKFVLRRGREGDFNVNIFCCELWQILMIF